MHGLKIGLGRWTGSLHSSALRVFFGMSLTLIRLAAYSYKDAESRLIDKTTPADLIYLRRMTCLRCCSKLYLPIDRTAVYLKFLLFAFWCRKVEHTQTESGSAKVWQKLYFVTELSNKTDCYVSIDTFKISCRRFFFALSKVLCSRYSNILGLNDA